MVERGGEGGNRAVDVSHLIKSEEPYAKGLKALWFVAHQWYASGDLETGGGELGLCIGSVYVRDAAAGGLKRTTVVMPPNTAAVVEL